MSQIGKPPCDDAFILHGVEATPCAPSSRRRVLAAAIFGSSMAFVDGTVVNVALPAIQRSLHATAFEAQWLVESYALFLAALLLVGGSLGDHFGRRRIFAIDRCKAIRPPRPARHCCRSSSSCLCCHAGRERWSIASDPDCRCWSGP
jgi:hypothetical protein